MNKTGIVIILLCFLAAAAVVLWERRKARKTMEEIERMLDAAMKASVRLVRFATIGTLNYLITMLVIWIVMSYFSFKGKYIVANIMAYLIAQTHNFIWSKYWIFPSSNPQNSLWQQIMLFCTAFGIAYGIQLLFVILMIEAIGIKEFTAQFIGIIIYGAVNFMVNNRITFR